MLRWGAPILVGCAPFLFGCECGYAPPCARIHDTAAIFLGKVVDDGPAGRGPFRFRVEEVFKGLNSKDDVTVIPWMCVAVYRLGERYLVMAGRWDDGALYTGDCNGTMPAASVVEETKVIRAWARGMPSPHIQGRLARDTDDSSVSYELDENKRPGVAGVRLTATLDGQTLRAISDTKGFFRIPVPGAGAYKLSAAYPGLSSKEREYEVEVEEGSCAEQNIGMWPDNRLKGRVIGPTGSPVSGIAVELMGFAASNVLFPKTAVTDSDGRYEFSELPQGDYLLGINLNGLNSKVPYEPRFYPGVDRRELAVAVPVGSAQTAEAFDFQIGERLPTRTIRIQGRANERVRCWSSGSDGIIPVVNARGEAVCEVLAGLDYHVDVRNKRLADVPAGRAPVVLQVSPELK